MSKTFKVTQAGHTNIFTDQTVEQVATRLGMMKGGDPITIEVERPLRDYDVFYVGGGLYSGDPKYTQWQGFGSQHRTGRGRTHREAFLNQTGWSQYGDGTRFLVVGPEYDFISERDEIVARLFEINTVDNEDDADFTVISPPENPSLIWDDGYPRRDYTITGHYTVKEVPA